MRMLSAHSDWNRKTGDEESRSFDSLDPQGNLLGNVQITGESSLPLFTRAPQILDATGGFLIIKHQE